AAEFPRQPRHESSWKFHHWGACVVGSLVPHLRALPLRSNRVFVWDCPPPQPLGRTRRRWRSSRRGFKTTERPLDGRLGRPQAGVLVTKSGLKLVGDRREDARDLISQGEHHTGRDDDDERQQKRVLRHRLTVLAIETRGQAAKQLGEAERHSDPHPCSPPPWLIWGPIRARTQAGAATRKTG